MSIIGFGRTELSSVIRVPDPPARMTTFMTSSPISLCPSAYCVVPSLRNANRRQPFAGLRVCRCPNRRAAGKRRFASGALREQRPGSLLRQLIRRAALVPGCSAAVLGTVRYLCMKSVNFDVHTAKTQPSFDFVSSGLISSSRTRPVRSVATICQIRMLWARYNPKTRTARVASQTLQGPPKRSERLKEDIGKTESHARASHKRIRLIECVRLDRTVAPSSNNQGPFRT